MSVNIVDYLLFVLHVPLFVFISIASIFYVMILSRVALLWKL